MRDREADIEKCKELENHPITFAIFAADALPEYITRCIELEEGLRKIQEITDRLLVERGV